jgi:cytoskeletal protein RodZ
MTEYDYTTQKRSWTRLFILLSLLLLVGVLIWAVFFRSTNAGETPPHQVNNQSTKSKSPKKPAPTTKPSQSTPLITPKKTSSPTPSTSSTASSNQDLANTGPGNDFTVFFTASALGVAANYVRIYRKRRHAA